MIIILNNIINELLIVITETKIPSNQHWNDYNNRTNLFGHSGYMMCELVTKMSLDIKINQTRPY